jgi:mannose-6-phosphate isomerase-like protein (cupin superfamily)
VSYTLVQAVDVEPAFGVFRKMRVALGVEGFGINQVELPPGASGREHDEGGSGHEEVYVVLAGAGTMAVDGEDVQLRAGTWLRVDAGSTRLPTAGPGGLTFIAVGAPPGRAYTPSPNL